MTVTLQDLQDRAEIRSVLERYCRGVDRLDEALIRSAYHADASDDHGLYKGSGQEFAAYVVKALREACAATMHTLGQSAIDLDGKTARVDTYFVAYHRRERDGVSYLDTFGGRYVDRFEKRLGDWRIARRVVVWEWSKTETLTASHYDPKAFTQGERSRADLSYRI